MILLVYVLLHLSSAATTSCSDEPHTSYYKLHSHEIPQSFYVPSTSADYEDPCQPITNAQMRRQYSWITNEYDIEHIIDTTNGPVELDKCNKDIRGNKVVAIATWNRAIGKKCWKHVEAEKKLVYGNVFDNAYQSVSRCCVTSTVYIWSFLCFTFVLVFGILGFYMYSYRQHAHELLRDMNEFIMK